MSKMKELIPIINNNGIKAVDGRVLHAFLGVGKLFAAWIDGRIKKYGFVDGLDYKKCFPNLESGFNGAQNKAEYIISIDMAKELAMVENNPKGREARKYFIECEKVALEAVEAVTAVKPLTFAEMTLQVIGGLQEQVESLTIENQSLNNTIETVSNTLDTTKKQKSAEKQWKTKNDKLVNSTKKRLGVKRDKDIDNRLESFVKAGKFFMGICETDDIDAVEEIMEVVIDELDKFRELDAKPRAVSFYKIDTFCKMLELPGNVVMAKLTECGYLTHSNGFWFVPETSIGLIHWSIDAQPYLIFSEELFKLFN